MVEMPLTVSHLLVAGEIRIFNFVESMNLLNVRSKMENCFSATFQFWAIPEIRKSLDKKIILLVYGENFLKETDTREPTNKGFVTMLLDVVRLIGHISVIEHFSEDFSN